MSLADSAASVPNVDLGLDRDLPSDPHAAEVARARAAATVAELARSAGLAALDGVLSATGGKDRNESGGDGARAAASDALDTARLLDREVARFRSLNSGP